MKFKNSNCQFMANSNFGRKPKKFAKTCLQTILSRAPQSWNLLLPDIKDSPSLSTVNKKNKYEM